MCVVLHSWIYCFLFKQKTAYEMRISDWSSDVCSSDLAPHRNLQQANRNGATFFASKEHAALIIDEHEGCEIAACDYRVMPHRRSQQASGIGRTNAPFCPAKNTHDPGDGELPPSLTHQQPSVIVRDVCMCYRPRRGHRSVGNGGAGKIRDRGLPFQ